MKPVCVHIGYEGTPVVGVVERFSNAWTIEALAPRLDSNIEGEEEEGRGVGFLCTNRL